MMNNTINKPWKSTGTASISVKGIKIASKVIDSYLCNIIQDLEKSKKETKIALVRQIYKKRKESKEKTISQ